MLGPAYCVVLLHRTECTYDLRFRLEEHKKFTLSLWAVCFTGSWNQNMFCGLYHEKTSAVLPYCKLWIISPGAYFQRDPFSGGLLSRGLLSNYNIFLAYGWVTLNEEWKYLQLTLRAIRNVKRINKRSPLVIFSAFLVIWFKLWGKLVIFSGKIPTEFNNIWGLIFRVKICKAHGGLLFRIYSIPCIVPNEKSTEIWIIL